MMEKTEKLDILLVDDRPENLIALEAILDGPDLNIVKATSGNEALGLVLEYDFALILLDVQMPEMDGFETAELIRGIERSKQVPIIFITALSKEDRYVFKGYQSGAVDYMSKPLNPDILKSKVKIFLDLDRQKRFLEKQTIELEQALAELKKTQTQILQSEKMASTGQLAVGVADEINNWTDLVNSNLKLLNKYRKDMESLLKVYEETEKFLSPEALKKIKKVKQEIDLDCLWKDFGSLIDESMEGTESAKKMVADLKDFSHVDQEEAK